MGKEKLSKSYLNKKKILRIGKYQDGVFQSSESLSI